MAATAPVPSPGLPAPEANRAPTAAPPSRHRRWPEAVLAIAVAVTVVGGLYASGELGRHATGASDEETFDQARNAAEAASLLLLGTGWVAGGAVGVDARLPTSVPVASLSSDLGSNCTLGPVGTSELPSQLEIPAFAGSFASGVAPLWIVLLVPGSGGGVAVAAVRSGAPTVVGEVGGAGCALLDAGYTPLPAGTVDSPAVASLAWSAAGHDYVTADPNLTTVAFAVFGGASVTSLGLSGVWAVVYAPCDPILGGTTSEPSDIATMNLTTGALLDFTANVDLDCPP
ncbi:MAG TPA: hypothetical protein VMH49_00110 [Thermoplasmata archaeon]|nr:hypothetical protein [Thermoplasmata archaeon]